MPEKKLRVGVIGAGVGTLHLAAYKELPRVEIAALAGLDDDRVRAAAAKYDVPQTYRHYEDLLARRDIDAALYAYNHSTDYVRAVRRFAARMRTDERMLFTYYAWQVYIRTPGGGVRRVTGPR